MTTYSYLLVLFILLDNYCSGYGYYYSRYHRKHFDPAIASFTKEPNTGSVWFTQHGDLMYLNGSVEGLPPNSNLGVHIHRYGGLGNMCLEAGPHFNPFNMRHGGRHGYPRHAGDLGNIRVDRYGVMVFDLYVTLRKLGPYDGFIGRALVIHANMDDLGRNPDEGSRTTGNSGPRLACAAIGYRAP
ncbi:hypothetical protein MN116_005209 [Schistosoma mekongi]|uniref:Superoxide dismutase [Cu-Zn] n=1 Tax=Schistosoma mekongi TaxID=38744 RepID=A0AAE1ZCN3_SCHME|nr:hypothetical protein MN116_005209 [Schistosoma mekongi]